MSNRTTKLPGSIRSQGGSSRVLVLRLACLVRRGFIPTGALLAALVLVAGCASKNPTQPPSRPREGIAEYRQLTIDAQQAMRAALSSLATVSAQSGQCPPAVLAGFSNEVHRVQVDSLRVRARSQAMLARGDAYFDGWDENLARISDPEVRALAQKQHRALHEGFLKIKIWSKAGHEAFQPFLAGLRKVRNALEKDPASLSADSTQGFIAAARTSGEEVESDLASIRRELDSMIAMLTPPGGSFPPQTTK